MKQAVIIGSGIAGLSAACYLARAGFSVTVVEKQDRPGGRARLLKEQGFSFDMGPSWYWMPDVFDRFFTDFGYKTSDFYQLQRLDPSYDIYWKEDKWSIPANYEALRKLFEQTAPGAGHQLDRFIEDAAEKYRIGMQKLAYKPAHSLFEFASWEVIKAAINMDLFTSMSKHISKYFKDEKLQKLLSFPILFLGALPENTPALYSLMNYADISLGTWYPEGGTHGVINSMFQLALKLGVSFKFNDEAKRILVEDDMATGVACRKGIYEADVVLGAADYHFVEQHLLDPAHRNYNNKYWEKRQMAPSCLLFYVGVNKQLPNLQHHSLFFDTPFEPHARDIYTNPDWPDNPMFYVCCPSRTDPTVAPPGHENLFILIPVAAGLDGDTDVVRMNYYDQVMARLEKRLATSIRPHVVLMKTYGVRDFHTDYNAYKGNAYGLANTLQQTAFLKPALRSSKVHNLFYTGQLTVPGPGMPPAIISGKLAASEAIQLITKKQSIHR
ncbi:phytoene desaturase [Chitinophaga jiangningensis]|uniref:Phytoene desaturase n=1 Tax=Chitinophaga jiangningensis TaxID=1419482 RepID=A0A1M7A612_9BACT|nr:phytoene desaturase family protein [Chitinophaga jiangningensis]SHL38142.1 phytoene desaturase [Chitinophaga jiangningensis]